MLPGPTAVTMEAKANKSTNLGGRASGRLNTCDKTHNLSLKETTDKKCPVPIQFELRNKQTVMPLGDHATHWSSYIRKVIRGVPLYYPSWLKVRKEQKATLIKDIGTQFDLRPHMESPDWTEMNTGIQGRAQPLRSTRRSLTPSSWHTLLTRNSFRMRTDVYTSGKCGDEEEGADDQDDEEEDGDDDTYPELSLGNGLNVVLSGSHHQGHVDCEFLETLEWTKSTVFGQMEAFMTCGNGTLAGWSVFMSEGLDDD
uniref:Uncharacterized protein n=1 Tax=Tanacetum cinerariifolium TaxID=118510 RepID=A0A6L2NIW9_TANCI|nr:hypothetical protein [Tanacetum cinerariifolium]